MKRLTALAKYLLGALLPLLILLFLPLRPVLICRLGESVVLKAYPSDPTDIFRGDYVSLSFDIETIKAEVFGDALKEAVRGSEWNVSLSYDASGLWQVSGVSRSVPSGAYITGTVKKASASAVTMDYGDAMSRIYVKEGSGSALEDAGVIRATVSLLRGEAVIRSAEVSK